MLSPTRRHCAQALAERQQARRDNRLDPDTATVSPSDLGAARLKLKDGSFAPGILASIIATTDRFVVAAEVHATDEIEVVSPMLDQAERLAAAVNVPGGRCAGDDGLCEPIERAIDAAATARDVPLVESMSPCEASGPSVVDTPPEVPDAPCTEREDARELTSNTTDALAQVNITNSVLLGAVCVSDACGSGCCSRRFVRLQLGESGIETARGDGNYLKGVVLREEEARGIELRVALGSLSGNILGPQGFNPDDPKAFGKPRFRLVVLPKNDYAPERRCMQCPMGALLHHVSHDSGRPGDPAHDVYRAIGVRCDACPYQKRCAPTKERRRVSRYPDDDLKERMRDRLAAAPYRQDARIRSASVEPVFSVLKGVQGLRRFHRRGLRKVRVEWLLHLVAHNLRRMMSLAGWWKAA